jgi:hypothetical protein
MKRALGPTRRDIVLTAGIHPREAVRPARDDEFQLSTKSELIGTET